MDHLYLVLKVVSQLLNIDFLIEFVVSVLEGICLAKQPCLLVELLFFNMLLLYQDVNPIEKLRTGVKCSVLS